MILHEGQTTYEAASSLVSAGVIGNARLFSVMSKLRGRDRILRTGRYALPLGISEYRALRIVEAGGDTRAFITIPEGFTLKQIAARLEESDICGRAAFLARAEDPSLRSRFGVEAPSFEGYLFPDSYRLPYGADPEAVISTMYNRFLVVYREVALESSGHGSGESAPGAPQSELALAPSPAVVTLASLVESEAALDSERPVIASVFLNRLRRRIPLQSCATVEYVLPQRKAVLTDADTRVESPYNTYLHPGLPPGPICCPGRVSLRAALYPAKTDYLFFLARGDRSHLFTRTFAEHAAAQRRSRHR